MFLLVAGLGALALGGVQWWGLSRPGPPPRWRWLAAPTDHRQGTPGDRQLSDRAGRYPVRRQPLLRPSHGLVPVRRRPPLGRTWVHLPRHGEPESEGALSEGQDSCGVAYRASRARCRRVKRGGTLPAPLRLTRGALRVAAPSPLLSPPAPEKRPGAVDQAHHQAQPDARRREALRQAEEERPHRSGHNGADGRVSTRQRIKLVPPAAHASPHPTPGHDSRYAYGYYRWPMRVSQLPRQHGLCGCAYPGRRSWCRPPKLPAYVSEAVAECRGPALGLGRQPVVPQPTPDLSMDELSTERSSE